MQVYSKIEPPEIYEPGNKTWSKETHNELAGCNWLWIKDNTNSNVETFRFEITI